MKTHSWFFLVIAILMWNGMLIKRDEQMYKAYYKQKAMKEFCANQAGWHPDCNNK